MQINKKEEAKMSKSIEVKKICNATDSIIKYCSNSQ